MLSAGGGGFRGGLREKNNEIRQEEGVIGLGWQIELARRLIDRENWLSDSDCYVGKKRKEWRYRLPAY